MPNAQDFAPPNFGRQQYGSAPVGVGVNSYHDEHDTPAYPAAPSSGYEDDVHDPNMSQFGPEEDDFYEDARRPRRRFGVMVVAGIFALAVIGTAGAFGYRALFGASGTSGPPPVIKAETAPSKIVPASSKDPQSSKLITDRVNDRGQSEKLVSREEQPVEIKDKPAGVVFPSGQDSSQSAGPSLGSGIVGTEPKRVRTIAIHPDQPAASDAAPAAAPPPAPARVAATAPAARPAAPPPAASNPPPAADPEPAPAPRQPAARAAPPPAASNAPLSLNPNAAPARAHAPPARTAAVAPAAAPAPAAPSGGTGSFAVQISSQRSEAEAQAAFRDLQGKFPGQLGGKQPLIRQVDLGDKGVYYRAMVGPFANGSDAVALCSSLKAAGGQCIIQKN
jgi:sporulation related protein